MVVGPELSWRVDHLPHHLSPSNGGQMMRVMQCLPSWPHLASLPRVWVPYPPFAPYPGFPSCLAPVWRVWIWVWVWVRGKSPMRITLCWDFCVATHRICHSLVQAGAGELATPPSEVSERAAPRRFWNVDSGLTQAPAKASGVHAVLMCTCTSFVCPSCDLLTITFSPPRPLTSENTPLLSLLPHPKPTTTHFRIRTSSPKPHALGLAKVVASVPVLLHSLWDQ